ncbi:heptaprenyl diphosphate synthase component 1 [Halalkalibacterium ligniniphilum]|uniref:heptaprenyl diphosphate synthase component 1 n=1 Tax=Halalkalibacterium ligniniphilum TaxID=1134413 RepID=UPI00034DD82F|nr:heptaprenyl diphosphate synthase component 1 [Halalkalibacterium ligniniphilum]
MVRMEHLNDKVEEIKQSFYGLIQHSYLQKYITEPKVDEDKIRFMYAMLPEKLAKKDTKVFILSALLAQAALDIHEEVSLHNIKSDSIKKNRQLKILAGDYYSSLYYYLLADGNHLPIIRIFSHSIQEINEDKMTVYREERLPYKNAEEIVKRIESILTQNMAEHFQLPAWKDVIADFFYLKRLIAEKEAWLKGKSVPLIRAIIFDYFGEASQELALKKQEKEDILLICEQKVEGVKDRLLTAAKGMQRIEKFVIDHVDHLLGSSVQTDKVAEEG